MSGRIMFIRRLIDLLGLENFQIQYFLPLEILLSG
jgi:hypothetical protein